jgi:hypothetical protein
MNRQSSSLEIYLVMFGLAEIRIWHQSTSVTFLCYWAAKIWRRRRSTNQFVCIQNKKQSRVVKSARDVYRMCEHARTQAVSNDHQNENHREWLKTLFRFKCVTCVIQGWKKTLVKAKITSMEENRELIRRWRTRFTIVLVCWTPYFRFTRITSTTAQSVLFIGCGLLSKR